MSELDAVVIGAGPAGEVCAGRLGEAGLGVTLVERELVGGECSYYACMPSKALLRPGDLVDEVRRVPGVQLDTPPLDVPRVLARRDEVIHDRDDSGHLPWLESRGVTLVRGHARLEGERRVRVGDDVLEARRAVVVATGSSALLPPIPGLAEAAPWTNREVTTASAIPGRLLILGGGIVGVEMAQAYAALGASVAIVEALTAADRPRGGVRLEGRGGRHCARHGVEVHLGAKADRGLARARSRSGSSWRPARALAEGRALVAIGRRAEHGRHRASRPFGVEPGKARSRSTPGCASAARDWLYAIGDANGRALLTHTGKYQGRVAAEVHPRPRRPCPRYLGRADEHRA